MSTFGLQDIPHTEDMKLSEQQIKGFKETFMLYDTDQDGVVTQPEVGFVMRSLGVSISDARLAAMIREYCRKDSDGVDFPEFMAMMNQCLSVAPPVEQEELDLVAAFKVFDPHGNGRITSRELRTIAMTLGETMDTKLVDHMIKEADLDGNGLIDYKEFVKRLLCIESSEKSHQSTG